MFDNEDYTKYRENSKLFIMLNGKEIKEIVFDLLSKIDEYRETEEE